MSSRPRPSPLTPRPRSKGDGAAGCRLAGGRLACPAGPLALPTRSSDAWASNMSGSVFAADEIPADVSFAAARCQLEHLARDGVLLGAAEYAYGAGTTGLVETAGPA